MTDLLPTVKVCVRFQHIFCRPYLISQDTDCNCCETLCSVHLIFMTVSVIRSIYLIFSFS